MERHSVVFRENNTVMLLKDGDKPTYKEFKKVSNQPIDLRYDTRGFDWPK